MGTACDIPRTCQVPAGTFLYSIRRRLPPDGDWEDRGQVCIGAPEEITERVTPERVLRAFRRLSWPEATLVVQPGDGETLVNLDTIFHAADDSPVTRTVTLLGQRIEIEATPSSWTWHWDRTGPTYTSEEPGAAYPDQTITHRYADAGVTAHPSVDVTYTGRYRVNDGDWIEIPGTHTVAGTPVPLRVLEARPTLVR
ncbi:MAG: hypothetical protein ACI379_13325 [Nocardioides sp.]|uniref:hypothetical protein n=1 Tax=Nocardioides sp. TaxID=35761 RepID=UPI003EFE4652